MGDARTITPQRHDNLLAQEKMLTFLLDRTVDDLTAMERFIDMRREWAANPKGANDG